MSAQQFHEFWTTAFVGVPPMGYLLRDAYADHWIRFHSLPGSKRYPDSNREMQIILDRVNLIANKLFSGEDTLWLVVSCPEYEASRPAEFATVKDLTMVHAYDWRDPADNDPDACLWSTFALKCSWDADRFAPMVRRIAENEEVGILLVSPVTKAIMAPYDGGIDIICRDQATIMELKSNYSDWLSPREDGF